VGPFRFAGLAFALALCLSAGAIAATTPDVNEVMSYDGLKKTEIKGIDLAYVRPGATLAGYHSVELAPVFVAFAKNWDPTVPGGPWKLSPNQRETIRTRIAKLVHDAFVKQLQGRDGFPVVTQSGPDVLLVKLAVINVYVTNPAIMTAGPSATFSSAAPGQATLYAEFFDSETGQILGRVLDTQVAQNNGGMWLSNSVTNYAAGQQVADQWAKILRDRLDLARKALATPTPVAVP
jgi:hypothetical protein